MTRGATIVTPNNRLSHQLLRAYMRHSADTVHDKPRCQPYPGFLRDRFKQVLHAYAHQSHPLLLNAHQERLLWQEVVSHNSPYPCTEGLINQVQDAWTRCQLWLIDIDTPVFLQTPQTQQFQRWHQAFQTRLSKHHAITESQLVPYLIEFPLALSDAPMIWVSFDDFTPQQRRLQDVLASLGIEQRREDLEARLQTTTCYAAHDTQDELAQLISWLNLQLATKVPRIAVIVPDLQQQSQALQRRLLRSIPASQFELSLGKALTDYPLVAHALHWLSLEKNTFTNHQVRLLLHSPYLGGAWAEFSERSKIMEDSRLLQEDMITCSSLLLTLQHRAPKLATLLEQLTDYPTAASPAEWSALFKARLMTLGFPGEYALNTFAYQTVQRFQTLFDDFSALAIVQPRMTKSEALNAFRDMAKATVFQVRKTPSPIQVLGLLEASGCEYDAIWVMGLTDQCLPQKVKLSPFIPMSLQREHHMPHALPEREYSLAKQLLERLQHGSDHCVFSYPRLTGDTPNLPSPLIREFPPFSPCINDRPLPALLLSEYSETYAWPLTETEVLSGGTSILAYQAQCPFRAFAAHRLHAKSGLKQSTGLNDAERGQVVHKVLEIIWKALGSQDELLKQSTDELNQLINQAIDVALVPIIQNRSCSFPPLIQSVERSRLIALIHASFAWEKEREPFVIKAIEQAYTLNLAGLDFSVRVDRLDAASENETWVIDYKSSIPPNKPWNEERPEAPQLLLYALLDDSINALLFLQLKAGQIVCSGISQEKQSIAGLTGLKKDETWTQKRDEWHQRLTQLAVEFRDGHCPPVPQRDSTCLTCDFRDLCRI